MFGGASTSAGEKNRGEMTTEAGFSVADDENACLFCCREIRKHCSIKQFKDFSKGGERCWADLIWSEFKASESVQAVALESGEPQR